MSQLLEGICLTVSNLNRNKNLNQETSKALKSRSDDFASAPSLSDVGTPSPNIIQIQQDTQFANLKVRYL